MDFNLLIERHEKILPVSLTKLSQVPNIDINIFEQMP